MIHKKHIAIFTIMMSGIVMRAQTNVPCFNAPLITYTVGLHPSAIAFGDVDDDVRYDIITANEGSNTISFLKGTGGGNFSPAVSYTVGNQPSGVVTSFFNNDLLGDIAVINKGSNDVSVLFGITLNASAFSTVTHSTGIAPSAIIASDFNGDAYPDLAITNSGSDDVSVLLMNPFTGDFFPAVSYTVGSSPAALCSDDMDGDGFPDLLIANANSNDMTLLLGSSSGSFSHATNYPAGTGPAGIATGDFNSDGIMDAVVANPSANAISVLIGQAGGSFAPAISYAAGSNPVSVKVGDINLDGLPDLIVANNGSANVSILLNTGSGSFANAVQLPAGASPSALAVFDYNLSLNPDIVVSNYSANTISILKNGLPKVRIAPGYAGTLPQVCAGKTILLLASAPTATAYAWSSGATSYTANVSPTLTTVYTASATSDQGCTNTGSISITALPLPVISLMSSQDPSCAGEEVILTASGADSYTWSPGFTQNSSTTVSPTVTTVYSVFGVDNNGCTALEQITQQVQLCTSLNENEQNTQALSLFPNPSNGLLNLAFHEGFSSVSIIISDIQGKELLSFPAEASVSGQKRQLELNTLVPGIYFLVMETEQGRQSYKLVLQ